MAAPHVAGVVALCIDEADADGPCEGKPPAEVITHMRSDAGDYNNANPEYGFCRDPNNAPLSSRYYGFLTRPVSSLALPLPPLDCGSSASSDPEPSPPPSDSDPPPEGEPPADSDPPPENEPPADSDPPLEGEPPPTDEGQPISNQFRFGKVNRNLRRGIARLIVRVPGPGRVIVRPNKRVRRFARRAGEPGAVAVRVRPRGKAQRRVSRRRCERSDKRRLRVRVRARVTYRPTGGAPRTKQRRVRLVRRC